MTVFVSFDVPVLAEVDLESGRVVRVRVNDEAVGEPTGVFSVGNAVSAVDLDRATAIAEHDEWPAWELGP